MKGLPGISKLASIAVCLLSAAATVAAETANERLGTVGDESNESATVQAEYARLMALARARHNAVSAHKGKIDVSSLPALGSADAVLAIVEFSSYQCGYCRRHFAETMPFLKVRYVNTGRLRYVFRDLVLDPSQQLAAGAAEAAYCADEQDEYLAFRSRLFQSGNELTAAALREYARSIGLDLTSFQSCIESGRHRAKSAIDPALRRHLQIRGTPTFIIGFLNKRADEVLAVRRISGARSIDFFKQQLAELAPATLRATSDQSPSNDSVVR